MRPELQQTSELSSAQSKAIEAFNCFLESKGASYPFDSKVKSLSDEDVKALAKLISEHSSALSEINLSCLADFLRSNFWNESADKSGPCCDLARSLIGPVFFNEGLSVEVCLLRFRGLLVMAQDICVLDLVRPHLSGFFARMQLKVSNELVAFFNSLEGLSPAFEFSGEKFCSALLQTISPEMLAAMMRNDVIARCFFRFAKDEDLERLRSYVQLEFWVKWAVGTNDYELLHRFGLSAVEKQRCAAVLLQEHHGDLYFSSLERLVPFLELCSSSDERMQNELPHLLKDLPKDYLQKAKPGSLYRLWKLSEQWQLIIDAECLRRIKSDSLEERYYVSPHYTQMLLDLSEEERAARLACLDLGVLGSPLYGPLWLVAFHAIKDEPEKRVLMSKNLLSSGDALNRLLEFNFSHDYAVSLLEFVVQTGMLFHLLGVDSVEGLDGLFRSHPKYAELIKGQSAEWIVEKYTAAYEAQAKKEAQSSRLPSFFARVVQTDYTKKLKGSPLEQLEQILEHSYANARKLGVQKNRTNQLRFAPPSVEEVLKALEHRPPAAPRA